MKSNTHNISKDKNNSCAVFSAIFACKIREATSSILTESAAPLCRSMNRAERESERESKRERGRCVRAVKARSRSRAVVPARDSQSKSKSSLDLSLVAFLKKSR